MLRFVFCGRRLVFIFLRRPHVEPTVEATIVKPSLWFACATKWRRASEEQAFHANTFEFSNILPLSLCCCAAPPDPIYCCCKLQEVQEPMMQASEGMAGNNNNAEGSNNTATPAANPSAGPNTSALPNPWAAAG